MVADLLKNIENLMQTFSKGQRKIATYVLEHYDKAAYMTASKLGGIVGVSESTIVRFAMQLGFEGYPEFQESLQEIIRTRLTSFQRMEVTNDLIGDSDMLSKVLFSDAEEIRRTLDGIDRRSFEEAVRKIISAKRIYILGVRSSSALAGFLAYHFNMIFENISLIQSTSGSEMFEHIMRIDKDDVMIAISFPRYSKRIINAVEFAVQKKANVIALTDSKFSPIAQYADELLVAQSDMVSFVDSLVAPLSVINAIIVAVAKEKKEELSVQLHKLENIWDEYDVYDKHQG
jgi:DNA-binding MurR/RpiR family transcriptional regulator